MDAYGLPDTILFGGSSGSGANAPFAWVNTTIHSPQDVQWANALNLPIGAGDTNRLVILTFSLADGGSTPANVFIGGVDYSTQNTVFANGSVDQCFVYWGSVPAANTVTDVRIFQPGSSVPWILDVYSASPSNPTPLDIAKDTGSIPNAVPSNLEIKSGGFVIFIAAESFGNRGFDETWNGIDAVVEDSAANCTGSLLISHSSGHIITTEDSTTRDLSVGNGGVASGFKVIAVSWI